MIGFFISDHPINYYKEIFDDYQIIDYNKFNSEKSIKQANIAATLLKIQERKTSKGNAYAIIKLSDLSSVFEIFIFSDILELNRDILIEGNSLLVTLNKNNSEDENRFKRMNVGKVALIKDIYNKSISKLELTLSKKEQIESINKLELNGNTSVYFHLSDNNKKLSFKLKKNRKVDRNVLNFLKNEGIITQIS